MKKLWLGSVALIALGVPATAADLAVKAPIVKAPIIAPVPYFNWTGCYLGAHVGGAWGRKDFGDPTGSTFAPPGETVEVKVSGWIGGAQLGCDYQIAANWVVGAEVDYSFADLKGSAADPFFEGKNLEARTRALATATGRVGYAMDRTLIYVKGGGAWARDRYDLRADPIVLTPPGIVIFPGGLASASETRSGWTVGFGLERAFWDNWSIKFEFDHYELGTRRITLLDPVNGTQDADIKQRIDAAKIGLNYRFGAAPVSARY
jgi:outer membrane immunogenic protein